MGRTIGYSSHLSHVLSVFAGELYVNLSVQPVQLHLHQLCVKAWTSKIVASCARQSEVSLLINRASVVLVRVRSNQKKNGSKFVIIVRINGYVVRVLGRPLILEHADEPGTTVIAA